MTIVFSATNRPSPDDAAERASASQPSNVATNNVPTAAAANRHNHHHQNALLDFYAQQGMDRNAIISLLQLGTQRTTANDEEDGTNSFPRLTPPHRFVRLNPRFDTSESLAMLQAELEETVPSTTQKNKIHYPLPIPWLDESWGFYAIPAAFSLSQSKAYTSGRCYGQDVSSGAAVAVLLTRRYDAAADDDDDQPPQQETAVVDDDTQIVPVRQEQSPTTPFPFRVLDLCCAPGLKLCAMADWLSQQQQSQQRSQPIRLVGVDVSEARLTLCKRVVHKYWIHPETSGRSTVYLDNHNKQSKRDGKDSSIAPPPIHIQLFCNDGTRFRRKRQSENAKKDDDDDDADEDLDLVFDSNVAYEETATLGGRKRMNKSARARERKRLKQIMNDESSANSAADLPSTSPLHPAGNSGWNHDNNFLFDRVLVDAECSTDGSLKHVQKKLDKLAEEATTSITTTTSPQELIPMLTDRTELSKLTALQRNLIDSGFQLLKDGGQMVYSTCSLSNDQNEDVVQWLLDSHATAQLVSVDYRRFALDSNSVRPGSLAGTVRFVPQWSASASAIADDFSGGGFFLAKIQKVESMASRYDSTME